MGGVLAVTAGVALAVRLVALVTFAPDDVDAFGLADPAYYHLQANLIAEGEWFVDPFRQIFRFETVPSATHPPLTSLVLATGSALGGTSLLAHQLVACVLGAATAVVVALVASAVAGPRAALAAGLLAAVFPASWLNDVTVRSETTFALAIAVVLLLAYRLRSRPSPAAAALLGAAVGMAALARAEGLFLVPLLALPLTLRPALGARWRVLAPAALAGTTFVLAPWVVWTARNFDSPVLLSNGFGQTVAGANCDDTYNGEYVGAWIVGCVRSGFPGDESEQAAANRRRGLRYAGSHLEDVPRVVLARVGRVWDVYRPLQNAEINGTEGRPVWATRTALAGYAVVAPLAVAGGVTLARRRQGLLWPLLVMAPLVTLTAVVGYGAPRLRTPADEAMVVLAAVAVDRLAARRPLGRSTGAVPPGPREGARRPMS